MPWHVPFLSFRCLSPHYLSCILYLCRFYLLRFALKSIFLSFLLSPHHFLGLDSALLRVLASFSISRLFGVPFIQHALFSSQAASAHAFHSQSFLRLFWHPFLHSFAFMASLLWLHPHFAFVPSAGVPFAIYISHIFFFLSSLQWVFTYRHYTTSLSTVFYFLILFFSFLSITFWCARLTHIA